MSHKRVMAIYKDQAHAIQAINKLETMGYGEKNIDLLVAENSWTGSKNIKIEKNTKAAEGVAIGAGSGAAIGAIVGGLTAVGAVAATGGAGLLASGPIVAALSGAGAAGAAGGLVGGLVGAGIPEVEAKFVDENLAKGHVLVGVEVDSDRADEVKSELDKFDAQKVSTL